MKYRVAWTSDAEADLARIWMQARNRRAVADAADRLDQSLSIDPMDIGESRAGGLRLAFASPLAIEFEVYEPDRTVLVLAVWSPRHGGTTS